MLQLWTPQIKSARAISRKMPELEVEWLDGEAVIYFPPEILDQVARLAGARKKRVGRKLSPDRKAKLVESGKAYRFVGKSTGLQVENLAQI